MFDRYIDCDESHEEHLHEGDEKLDRYSDIKSYKHNIIPINTKQKYINASPINIITKNYFISTQGPKEETIEDFWTMVEQYDCNIIVMLCKEMEQGRTKCAKYWEKKKYKNYTIKEVNEEETKKEYIIREIQIINNDSKKEKKVHQIHFTGWPDHGVPDISNGKIFETFCEMNALVDSYRENNPIVVHCSAGVGRTGTFISMYFLEKEIKDQINNNVKEIQFSIFNLVRKLKEMRLYMVQTEAQYKFIYDFVNYLLETSNK